MNLRRELLLIVGTLVALNVLFAFGAIGLFVRMGPAIEKILEENVYSIVAAEEILAELANAGDAPVSHAGRARIGDALDRARSNVTEPAETPVLQAIERHLDGAMAGVPVARSELVAATRHLIAINRDAMKEVDGDAKRLGSAGAWVAVVVGFLTFALSLVVFSRLRKRLVEPLVELHQVLEGVREGELYRRCRACDAPIEVRQVISSVNRLLDERSRLRTTGADPAEIAPARAALVALLDRVPGGALVADRGGQVASAGNLALEALAGDGGDRVVQALAALARGEPPGDALASAEPLPGGVGWVCVLDPSVSARPADADRREQQDAPAAPSGQIAGGPGPVAPATAGSGDGASTEDG